MIEIFLSYRHSDDHTARLVYEWLISHGVPENVIFYDVAGLPPGHHFPTKIKDAATQATIMVVLIGADWTMSKRHWYSWKTKINEADDWVRQEIGVALTTGTEVLPVNLEDTPVPSPHKLPPELRSLCSI